MASTGSTYTSSEQELIDRVHSYFPDKNPTNYHFFYATASPFSNFHKCSFTEDGIQFTSSEQYMMYHKAKLFSDDESAQAILEAKHPSDCKALGRNVQNFDMNLWLENRTKIVSNALYLKFTQDEKMKVALLEQQGKLLVEAAASDDIWGVGLHEKDPLIRDRSNWKGLNLLGYILTDILHRISK